METGAISTASPASQSGAWRLYPLYPQKCPPMAGFCELAIGLRAPKLDAAGAKSPIVSGGYLKYSRFRETATGDRVRPELRGGRGSCMWRLAEKTLRKASFLLGTAYYVQTRRNAALFKRCQMPSLPIGAWDRSLPVQESATSARLISLADSRTVVIHFARFSDLSSPISS